MEGSIIQHWKWVSKIVREINYGIQLWEVTDHSLI